MFPFWFMFPFCEHIELFLVSIDLFLSSRTTHFSMNSWGISTAIDLFECRPLEIREPSKITEFLQRLVALIDMKAYGEPIIVRFGSGNKYGYSAIQLIETSAIVCHFDETGNNAYIDIFSCKDYDVEKATDFCMEFFGAERAEYTEVARGTI